MGSGSKQMRYDDKIEGIETRRRSSRIVALEEKRHQEIEREIALELERKNKPINHDIRKKGKGKATIKVSDDSSDLNKEDGSIWQADKNKELHQLLYSIKSLQELGKQSHNASTPETNDSSQDGILLKKMLEIIIDFLQRKDLDELFAEPNNPDVEENYFNIVKQPMDFGTMRAKLHEGMYTDMWQFKRDIMLICTNAMTVRRTTSKCYQVAKEISGYAKWIFEALRVNFGDFQLEFALNKKCLGRKPQTKNHKSSRMAAPKSTGRKNVSTHYVMVPETDKRDTYCPPHKSLASEILNANKPNALLNKDPMEYEESLLRFVEDLGPTAQRVAGKKLEPLKDQPLENMLSPWHVQENSDIRKWDTSANTPNTLAIGNSSNVFACVHPTRVISGPSTMLSLMPHPRLEDTMHNMKFPGLSLESHSWPKVPMSCMPRNNFPELSPMQQPRQRDSMYDMSRNNPIELPLMHQPWKEQIPLQEPNPSSSLEEAPPQLLQDNDEQPNLDLRL